MAGSAKAEQVNRSILVTDQDDRARLSECGKLAHWIACAPVVIAVVALTEEGRPFDYGRMTQNMLVQANALGLASCPMKFHDQDRARKVLGLPDDPQRPHGVAVGKPAPSDADSESSPRVPLDEQARWAAGRTETGSSAVLLAHRLGNAAVAGA